MKFLGNRAAAYSGPALENEWLESGFRQIESGNQPVVPSANDDHVALIGHELACSLGMFQDLQRRQSPGGAHDTAAGMRRRAAHPQVLDGRLVLRPARH